MVSKFTETLNCITHNIYIIIYYLKNKINHHIRSGMMGRELIDMEGITVSRLGENFIIIS